MPSKHDRKRKRALDADTSAAPGARDKAESGNSGDEQSSPDMGGRVDTVKRTKRSGGRGRGEEKSPEGGDGAASGG